MYLALARKYRPQLFKDLIGQPHITRTLQNAIQMNKLYPALIFSGMKGVGKTSAARILSKALNCEKGPAVEPCNNCEICKEITEDNSSDYIEIDGASNNGVEEVRSLRETVKYKPLKNRFRVIVIDEVHMLSNSAWNALLKTIEEPPEHTYFIMATTDFHKIPATIVSRCQHFEFKRIPFEVITNVLKEICVKEKIKISDYALKLISKSSEGSLRDAKKILDQAIAISSGNVKDQDIVEILAIIEEEIFIRLIRGVLSKDRKAIIELVNELCERGLDLRFFYGEFLKFLRNLIILKSVEDAEPLHNLNPENIPEIMEIIDQMRDVELLRYFNAVKEIEQAMKYTENPRIMLEYLLIKLSFFPSLRTIEEIINQAGTLDILKSVQSSQPETNTIKKVPSSQPKSDHSGKTEKTTTQALTDETLREQIISKIENAEPRLASALGNAALVCQGDTISIKLNHKFANISKIFNDKSEYLKKIFSDIKGQDIHFEISVDKKIKDDESKEIEEIRDDKNIHNLMNKIKGKIISIDNIKGGNNG